jgi:hypothetical protein
MGWSPEEQDWVRSLTVSINRVIRNTASRTRVIFAPVDQEFDGHEICGPEGTWFVEPNVVWGSFNFNGMFHPDRVGHSLGYRKALESVIPTVRAKNTAFEGRLERGELLAEIDRLRGFIKTMDEQNPTVGELGLRRESASCSNGAIPAGSDVVLYGGGYSEESEIAISLRTDSLRHRVLTRVDDEGRFEIPVTLEEAVPLATIEVEGTGQNGQHRLLLAWLSIGPSEVEDTDDDGIPDVCDICPGMSDVLCRSRYRHGGERVEPASRTRR